MGIVQTIAMASLPFVMGSGTLAELMNLANSAEAPGAAGFSQIFGGMAFLAISTLGSLLVVDLYFFLFEYYRQQTPGKMLLQMKVISQTGDKLTPMQCVWREVFRHIDVNLIFPGFIAVLVTEDKQRIGDLVAKTQVVDDRKR